MSHPVRPCYACGVFDDHPRHVVADPLVPEHEELMHMDCCRDVRGCGVCAAVLESVGHTPGVIGEVLRERLVVQPAVQVEHEEGDRPFGSVILTPALGV